jgi:hypothetical protein
MCVRQIYNFAIFKKTRESNSADRGFCSTDDSECRLCHLLSWQACPSGPVLAVVSREFCFGSPLLPNLGSVCPVLAVLAFSLCLYCPVSHALTVVHHSNPALTFMFCLACSACPLLPVPFCLCRFPGPFCLSRSAYQVSVVPFLLVPFLPVPFGIIFAVCPVLAVLSFLFCPWIFPGSPVLVDQSYWQARSWQPLSWTTFLCSPSFGIPEILKQG